MKKLNKELIAKTNECIKTLRRLAFEVADIPIENDAIGEEIDILNLRDTVYWLHRTNERLINYTNNTSKE